MVSSLLLLNPVLPFAECIFPHHILPSVIRCPILTLYGYGDVSSYVFIVAKLSFSLFMYQRSVLMGPSTTAAAERTHAPKRTRSFVASCSLRMQRSERRSSHGVPNLARVRRTPIGPPHVGVPSPVLDDLLKRSRDEAYAELHLRLQSHNLPPPLPFHGPPVIGGPSPALEEILKKLREEHMRSCTYASSRIIYHRPCLFMAPQLLVDPHRL